MIDCGCDEILLPQGSNGVDGKNAFTVTTASFTQPAALSNVTITVSDSLQNTNQWAIPGQVIRITDASGNGGWYQVVSITGTTQILVTNLGYTGSTTAGLTIATGAGVSPAGLQGPQGDPGTAGGQGPPGDPNTLSIPPGGVTTLAPGQPATVTIGGSAPNQTLTFGIPQGLPGTNGLGKTLQWQYNNNSSVTIAPPPSLYQAIVPQSGFDIDGSVCPNNGDAFRVTFWTLAKGTSTSRNNDITFNIQLQIEAGAGTNQSLEYQSTSTDVDNIVNMFSIPVVPSNIIPVANDPQTTFKLELIVQRLSSTAARYFLSWVSMSGSSRVPISHCYSANINYNFNNTDVKKIQVNAIGGNTSVVFSRMSMIIEKITI